MISTPVRLTLILVALLGGTLQVVSGNRAGFLLVAVAALFVYGHFRYGTVWLASRALKAGKLDRAARLLSQVKRPSTLASEQRAYFELASGQFAGSRGDRAAAEQHFRTAVEFNLRTENNRCLAEVSLARLLAERGEVTQARELLARARTRGPGPEISEELERVEAALEPGV